MAYKVLGQAVGTAAAASTTTNLVKDPSFRNLIGSAGWIDRLFTDSIYNSGTNANVSYVYNINNNAHWGQSVSTTTQQQTTNTGNNGVTTAPFGNTKTAIGNWCNSTASNWQLTYGMTNTASLATPVAGMLNTATAIPVTGGLTYYGYWNHYQSAAPNNTPEMDIWWFTSAGAMISATPSAISGTYNTATWARMGGSVVAPNNAAWATFAIYTNAGGGQKTYLDAVYFGTDSASAITFTEPLLPSETTAVSPFDKKINGYQLETPISTSGVTYAGAQVVLYTVPAGKSTVVSTLSVANLSSNASSYRVAVIPSGESLAAKHFTHMDIPISGNSTQTITVGMTLNAGDKIQVAADTATVAFTAFGSES